jgi:hypothetical protein
MELTECLFRGGARVAEWDRLLSGCRGECFDRGFESRPPRQKTNWEPLPAKWVI